MTSLDDLLDRGGTGPGGSGSAGSGQADRSPLARQLSWALKASLAAAGLGAALVSVLLVLGYSLRYPLAVAAVLAALLLHRTVTGLRTVPAGQDPGSEPDREPAQVPDPEPGHPAGLVPAVHRWQARLRPDRSGRQRASRSLQPSLAELVDQRLHHRHGCTRASDPVRARGLLGERLWRYLADPAARTPPPEALAAMLTTVEEL